MTAEEKSVLDALVRKARRRNAKRKAKADLIDFLRSNLRSWIENEFRKRGVPSQDMEDALQELCKRVLQKISKWGKPAAFMLFLRYKIQDVAKEYWKGPKLQELVEEVYPSARPPMILGIDLAKALSQLPSGDADAFVLVDVMGYTYKEAAKALGWKFSTLKKRLELTRPKVRALLADPSRNEEKD